jgi:trehalose-6-phosphate synthase
VNSRIQLLTTEIREMLDVPTQHVSPTVEDAKSEVMTSNAVAALGTSLHDAISVLKQEFVKVGRIRAQLQYLMRNASAPSEAIRDLQYAVNELLTVEKKQAAVFAALTDSQASVMRPVRNNSF